MMWEENDDYSKTISLVAYEVESIKKAYFTLGKLKEEFYRNLEEINICPSFFSEALDGLRYKVVVGTAKLLDKSSGNFISMLNKGEQERKSDVDLHKNIIYVKKKLAQFDDIRKKVNTSRDHYFAHLDRISFNEEIPDNMIDLFNENEYKKLGELLDFLWDTLNYIFKHCSGDKLPELVLLDDLPKLIEKLKSKSTI